MALSADYEYKLSSHHGAPMRKVQKITLINKRLHFESLSRIPARPGKCGSSNSQVLSDISCRRC